MFNATVAGNVGRLDGLKKVGDRSLCNFTIASTKRSKDANGDKKEITTWVNATVWGRQAEIAAEYLEKGRFVIVTGEVYQHDWTDKEGRQRVSINMEVSHIELVPNNNAEKKEEKATAKK